jgi:AcrR family transcriptional regulator
MVSDRRRVIEEASLLIAEAGVRGATLRKVGERAGVNFARLASTYGGKERLIGACFAEAVAADLAQLRALVEEHDRLGLSAEMVAPLLWSLCEDAGGGRRTTYLVLTELLLAADRPAFAAIARGWILERHGLLRSIAAKSGLDPVALDVLGLGLLMECAFAVSNRDSFGYRLIAEAGFNEAFARLTGIGNASHDAALQALSKRYHINYDDQAALRVAAEGEPPVQGKAQIIDAAAAILEEEGPDRVTNRAVAQRAGVSLALTTYHFRSIHELTLAGLRRAVEIIAASLAPAATREEVRAAMLIARRRPTQAPERDVRIHRGMLYISLTATRSGTDASLGHLVRRQLGMLAYAAVDAERRHRDTTRTCASSYALWSAAAYLIAPTLSGVDHPLDFEAQSALASRRLLGLG